MREHEADRDERLEELKLRFVEAWESGSGPDVERYALEHAEFAGELTRFGVRFALVYTGPEPGDDECDDFDAADAMRRVLQEEFSGDGWATGAQVVLASLDTSLGDCLNAKGARVDELAQALKLPTGFAYMLVQGAIDPPPPKLVDGVARYCDVQAAAVLAMLSQPSSTAPSYLLRSGSGGAASRAKLTFAEGMERCRRSGELTPEHEAEWAEEMRP